MPPKTVVYSPEWNDELKQYARARKVSDLAGCLDLAIDADPAARLIVEGKLGVWLRYFQQCADGLRPGFSHDPLRIDQFLIEFSELRGAVVAGDWPMLDRLYQEILALAQATFLERRGLWFVPKIVSTPIAQA